MPAKQAWLCVWVAAFTLAAKAQGISTATETVIEATLSRAVSTHPSVFSARESKTGSEANYDAATWQYFPSPSISTERSRSETQPNSSLTTTTTLRLQQNLWTGGKIDAEVETAQQRVLLTKVSVLDAKTSVANRTLDAWLALLTSFGRQQSSKAGFDRLNQLSDMMNRRVEQAVSPSIDAVLLRSRVLQLQGDILSYGTAKEVALKRLALWVGDETLTSHLADHTLRSILDAPLEVLPESTHGQLVESIGRQPGLRRNLAELEIAQQELNQKRSNAWPSVYLRLDRQFSKPALGGFFGSPSAETKVYLGMQYTPGAGLSQGSIVNAAESRVSALKQDSESIRRDLLDRVLSGWRDYLTNIDRLQLAVDSSKAAAEVLDSYTRQFVIGRRTWMDVLNAARDLNSAALNLNDLRAQLTVSGYRVRMDLCRFDWQNEN